ncbi:MAG: hypothetical protein CVV27_02485 [Candidatus Melainabacteria bacterium HGW-Melainabacteria-1]|nr:MAG: hypothetical protein CVV27_02485 [Candidatus Melainabacteria bacterium HGW-Melainabacteria-1]
MSQYQLFGIRHHGPGSARSLLRALDAMQPDCLLIEGPLEAEAALEWIGHAGLVPPVALLIYCPDLPRQAVYYPFAAFSPEWQALGWAKAHQTPVRWMDLPQSAQLGGEPITVADIVNPPSDGDGPVPGLGNEPTLDPFDLLGRAAGYDDGERYWEDLVEQRRDGEDVFAAIRELMAALREEHPLARPETLHELRREAWMRQTLRQALKDGYQRIAVVCGAWHVPAVKPDFAPAKADKELLKNLPKLKTAVSWIPWTHDRLGRASGYGAGIDSPGWYAHLWQHQDQQSGRWMARVAKLLRAKGLDVSSAHLIEAVRLAEALAALRAKPQPGLSELNEATLAVLTHGQPGPLQLIREQLIVGQALGQVPAELPQVPLQQDLEAELRRLRLKLGASDEFIKLDLRKVLDRDKSALLHRLLLLDLPWGSLQQESGRKGSFGESWQLRWEPEFSLRLIEAGVWGHTLAGAAAARTLERAGTTQDLGLLTQLLDQVLLADLTGTIPLLMQSLANLAALTSDLAQLMQALPPLGRMLRYGSVRQLDTAALRRMLDGLLARVCLGLPPALSSLDEAAARALLDPLAQVHEMLRTLQEPEWLEIWLDTLAQLAARDSLNGLLAGYFARLLFDLGRWPLEQLEVQLSRLISPGTPSERAAGWIEGLLQGSGLLLVHHQALLSLLDRWVTGLTAEQFLTSLPLLRRSFSRFADAERRQIGELIRQGAAGPTPAGPVSAPADLDLELARLSLPILHRLLGEPVALTQDGQT